MKVLFVNKKISILFIMLICLSVIMAGCNASRTAQGGAIGATSGGILGGILGNKSDQSAQGAIIGAAIGGAAGALIGDYMDRQAMDLENELENAEVERVEEGIKITFDSGILFDVDSDELRAVSRENLDDLADVLQDYEDTEILIAGHTDSTGPEDYNEELSWDRAESVEDYLDDEGVKGSRMVIAGHGEKDPVATNETETGRQENRRVEVAIYANNKLKRAAKRGDI